MKWVGPVAAGIAIVTFVFALANVREEVVRICEIDDLGLKRTAYRVETSDGSFAIPQSTLSDQEEVLRGQLIVGKVVRLNYKAFSGPWVRRTIRGVNPVSGEHSELICPA